MEKILRIAWANIRKNKSQSLSFMMITGITALLLNLGLITGLGYEKNFDTKATMLSSPDVVFAAQTRDTEIINGFEQELQEDERSKEVEKRNILLMGSDFTYAGGEQSRRAVFLKKEENPSLGKVSIMEEAKESIDHPVYLPYLFKVGGKYEIKDTFHINVYTVTQQKKGIDFTVAGFYEDTFLSTINNTMTGFILPEKEYEKLEQDFGGEVSGTQFSVKLKDSSKGEMYTTQNYDKLAKHMETGRILDSNHYENVKSARTITSTIGALIIICFSLISMVISLVVIKFRISNSISEEMQNIGALKAIGYTSGQLVASFFVQFVLLAVIGATVGIAVSYAALPALSAMFAIQTGVVWEQSFSVKALLITMTAIVLSAALVSVLSSARIRKLPVIIALRNGMLTHSFRKNYFPLDQNGTGLTAALAGKQLAHNRKQNALVGTIVLLVTFAAVFGGVLYYNIVAQEDTALILVSGEVPDAMIEAENRENAETLLSEIKGNKKVDTAFLYATSKVTCEGESEAYCYIMEDFKNTRNPYWNFEGRFPKYENETAIGVLLGRLLKKEIGDSIVLEKDGKTQEYLITGLIQGSNYMGHDLCITEEGYARLDESLWVPAVNVYLKENIDTDAFLKKLEKESQLVISASNTKEIIKSSMSAYQMIISVLAIVIYVVTAAMIALVLLMVIKTMLLRRRRELGIQKAIGFTTFQLALQNTWAFFTVIAVGALLGCVSGYFFVNPFLGLLFSSIGIAEMNFAIPPALLLCTFGGISLMGFLVSLGVSMRIRKITPYTLMSE